MQNQEHLVRRQEEFTKGQDAKMSEITKELEKQSRITDIYGTFEARTEAISSQMKVQSDVINRLDMRIQSVEADSRRLSKAPSPPSIPPESTEDRESAEKRATALQDLPEQPEGQREIIEEESQIEDYDVESMDEPDENESDFLSPIVPKNSHPDSTALKSALQGSQEERLHKAGLQRAQTSIPIAQKEQSSIPIVMPNPIRPIPMVVSEFANADIITKPHLPDITYARGATHIKKSIEERRHIHQVIVVNVLTHFGTQTGIFLDLDTQRFYAEIRSEDHPQYDFGPQDQPPTPIGYNGKWFINKMDPSM